MDNDLMSEKDQPVKGYPAHALLLFALVFLLWLLLTASLDFQEMGAGLLVALVVTLSSLGRLSIMDGLKLSPMALIHMARYLGYFFFSLIRANLDMARRVLSPALPINPAMVEVRTALKSDLGRMLLANSITLTPGTLTVDVIDDSLQIHWIDCPAGSDMEQITQSIAAGFEQRIGGFLK
jgi:multicomponent Na+:H+ antiporter subunit E